MTYYPTRDSNAAKTGLSSSEFDVPWRSSDRSGEPASSPDFESDLAQLARTFAAHSNGVLSPESSADLALEIVLNQIVEQACLATAATGAAVVLERGGDMVCRASTGANAPELGAHLDTKSGLSRLCLQTRQIQRCDDAQNDPRADAEASRLLGVRSVMILPLLRDKALVGVFEVFSSLPAAFGERDERTLEALGEHVLKNLENAAAPFSVEDQLATSSHPMASDGVRRDLGSDPQSAHPSTERLFLDVVHAANSSRGLDVLTWVLGLAVLGCAVFVGVLIGHRFERPSAAIHTRAAKSHAAATAPSGVQNRSLRDAEPQTAVRSLAGATPAAEPTSQTAASAAIRPSVEPLPPGSLVVYDHGRVVYWMKPPAAQNEPAKTAQQGPMEPASSIEPERTIKLSPAEAEGSVLHRVEPDYPEAARQQQIQGSVELEVGIGTDGAVEQLKVMSGPPALGQAAMDAVKQWRFKPRTVNGQAAEMQTTVRLNFRLPR